MTVMTNPLARPLGLTVPEPEPAPVATQPEPVASVQVEASHEDLDALADSDAERGPRLRDRLAELGNAQHAVRGELDAVHTEINAAVELGEPTGHLHEMVRTIEQLRQERAIELEYVGGQLEQIAARDRKRAERAAHAAKVARFEAATAKATELTGAIPALLAAKTRALAAIGDEWQAACDAAWDAQRKLNEAATAIGTRAPDLFEKMYAGMDNAAASTAIKAAGAGHRAGVFEAMDEYAEVLGDERA